MVSDQPKAVLDAQDNGGRKVRSPVAALIPAYNEAATVASIVMNVRRVLDHVYVIDDASTDDTARVAELAGAHVIRQARNHGKGNALYMGMEVVQRAGFRYVVTLDGDGQHRPQDIPLLLDRTGPDCIVIGSRMSDRHLIPSSRYRANLTANFFISWACGTWIEDTQCGFRVYPLTILNRTRVRGKRRFGFVFESEVLIEACRSGFHVRTVPIPALYDGTLKRASHFRPVRDIAAIVSMVTGKILIRGFYPLGLLRSQNERRHPKPQTDSVPTI